MSRYAKAEEKVLNVRRCIVCARYFDADIEIECCGGSYIPYSRSNQYLKYRLEEQRDIDNQKRKEHIASEWRKTREAARRAPSAINTQEPERLEEIIPPVVFVETVIIVNAPKKNKKKWRKNLDPEVRQMVLRRDKRRCTECSSKEGLHVHHIVHRKDGGGNEMENLTTLCELCHAEKHRGEPIYNIMVKSLLKQISI